MLPIPLIIALSILSLSVVSYILFKVFDGEEEEDKPSGTPQQFTLEGKGECESEKQLGEGRNDLTTLDQCKSHCINENCSYLTWAPNEPNCEIYSSKLDGVGKIILQEDPNTKCYKYNK